MGEIKLTDVIAPAFYGVHWDIIDGKHTYYDLFGVEVRLNHLLSGQRYHLE